MAASNVQSSKILHAALLLLMLEAAQRGPRWVSGDDPMTDAQASYLKTLSEQAHDPEAFSDKLSKAEASKRIDALKAKIEQVRAE